MLLYTIKVFQELLIRFPEAKTGYNSVLKLAAMLISGSGILEII